MRRSSERRRALTGIVLVGTVGIAFSSGCTMLYDLNTTQCEVTADCDSLGFQNTTCVNRVCVAEDASGGTGGKGGAGGTGGAGIAGTGGDAGANGGTTLGGASGTGGAGSGGTGAQPECETNDDCITAHLDQPWICKDEVCLQVTTEECPLLLPTEDSTQYLREGNAIMLGGFSTMENADNAYDTLSVVNWDLAFTEFNDRTLGGLEDGTRPLLALLCNGSPADVGPSVEHLTLDMEVPAMLTTLSPDKLLDAYNITSSEEHAAAGGDDVFYLSTGSANATLANLRDKGLIWHMLGSPRVLSATTAGLVRHIEEYVQAQRADHFANFGGEDPSTTPLRVTLITADDPTLVDISNVLTSGDLEHPEANLTFNGDLAINQLASGDFRSVGIESNRVHTDPDVSAGIQSILDHPPHIVIAMASDEFAMTVIPAVEGTWDVDASRASMLRPYYVFSHFLANTAGLPNIVGDHLDKTPPLDQRLVGVNFAAAQDARAEALRKSYEARLLSFYGNGLLAPTLLGTENHYDGAYSLIYAVAAAVANGDNAITAEDIRDGLQDRVLSEEPDAESVDIGPNGVAEGMSVLNTLTSTMALYATMGPPNFDRSSGTRVTTTSAWCIDASLEFVMDGLVYDEDTDTFVTPLSGEIGSCLEKY